MYIGDLLKEEFIHGNLASKTKADVLAELCAAIPQVSINGAAAVVEVLLAREKLGSTGIGDGIAIPHGKLAGLSSIIVSCGRSVDGVEYESLDGKQVHLFFLLLAPEHAAGQHLKVLAKISRMLKDPIFRDQLIKSESVREMYERIIEKDKECL